MELYFNQSQLKYSPKQEFSGKDFREYPEKPDRIKWILDEVIKQGQTSVKQLDSELCPIEKLSSVHDPSYVEFMANLPNNIEEQVPMTIAPGNSRIKPLKDHIFESQLGYYFFSVDTPITSTAFEAAHYSVSSALMATQAVISRNQNIAFGLSRPPGHHAMKGKGGGYCFFNNVAIAAQDAVEKGHSVSILDLDFHHGNGTQEIFYDTDKVQYVSLHAKDAYPYYWGAETESGELDGKNHNHNHPLLNTTAEDRYLETLDLAMEEIMEYSPKLVLVSMGFDCYYKDPIAGMQLTDNSYMKIGEKLRNFDKLSLILEGGYSEDIGKCFIKLLEGLDI